MTQNTNNHSSTRIWAFVGYILVIYGVLIGGVGIFHLVTNHPFHTALASIHPDILWGLIMFATGIIFCLCNRKKSQDPILINDK